MLKILPFVAVGVIALGLIGWRLTVGTSKEVIKTQVSTDEERIKELEFTVTDLISQFKGLPVSSQEGLTTSDLDSRLKRIEDSLNDLKARIVILESKEPTTAQTTSTATSVSSSTVSRAPAYIPLGWSGSSAGTDWTSIIGQEFIIDTGDYAGYTSMQFEVNMRIFQNGQAFARLEVKDMGTSILASEVSTVATDYTWVSSAGFTLQSGKKTYRLQLKSLTGYSTDVINARIKVNF